MLPVSEPLLEGNELNYLRDCIDSGWISSGGTFVARFEQAWAEYCGRTYGVAVANGTAALQLAVEALSLAPGDEVVIPSFTIISCALAVLRAGAKPVVVDSDPETFCIDLEKIASAITPRTRAIMPVHIYGHPVDMDPLLELAERWGIDVIEDAAQAHGSEYLLGRGGQEVWRRCGSFGTISIFSFYANKIITTGEGGMVMTNREDLAERCRSLRNLCFQSRRFYHEGLGYNYRLTNMQAAIGVAQLERIADLLERKRRVGELYDKLLADVPGIELPRKRDWARINRWMYSLVLGDEIALDASEFAIELRARGVDTRPFFMGLHEQPIFRSRGLFENTRLPVAERLTRRGICLPSGPTLTPTQIEAISGTVREVVVSALRIRPDQRVRQWG
jgi:perosamine synthetase